MGRGRSTRGDEPDSCARARRTGAGRSGAEDRAGGSAIELVVPASLGGERVDRVLCLLTGMSRSQAAALVAAGSVEVAGRPVTTRSRPVLEGERLRARVAPLPAALPIPDARVQIRVVHEDADLVVVDKPAGLVVHHGAGHTSGTLVEGLLARYPELARPLSSGTWDPQRPGIVHRLDKQTSGLLVVARTPAAYASLSRQFRTHSATRQYRALVVGTVVDSAGIIDAPVGRSVRIPTRMAVTVGGRPARTSYRVVARYSNPVHATLLDVRLETGRTHQVRVHLAAIGHPVVGDDRYGAGRGRPRVVAQLLPPGRLFLHAWRLSLEHPAGGQRTWESPLPGDLQQVLDAFEP